MLRRTLVPLPYRLRDAWHKVASPAGPESLAANKLIETWSTCLFPSPRPVHKGDPCGPGYRTSYRDSARRVSALAGLHPYRGRGSQLRGATSNAGSRPLRSLSAPSRTGARDTARVWRQSELPPENSAAGGNRKGSVDNGQTADAGALDSADPLLSVIVPQAVPALHGVFEGRKRPSPILDLQVHAQLGRSGVRSEPAHQRECAPKEQVVLQMASFRMRLARRIPVRAPYRPCVDFL